MSKKLQLRDFLAVGKRFPLRTEDIQERKNLLEIPSFPENPKIKTQSRK